jgi:sulfur carrier protein ThiS
MKIHVDYGTQVRVLAAIAQETMVAEEPISLAEFLQLLATHKGATFSRAIFGDEGKAKPGVLIFVNDESIAHPELHMLCEGDRISVLSMVSGG